MDPADYALEIFAARQWLRSTELPAG